MTNYTDVISLAQAKLYLKIDSGQTVTDNEITGMINSALSFIEKRTQHIFKTRDKVYYKDCALLQQTTVYDYPIDNSETAFDIIYKTNKAIVPTINDYVTLTVGYDAVEDIPSELIDSALQLINFWFYNSETKNAMNTIPDFVLSNLDVNRRFL
tara:strand:- start:1587 stop:2048 length:462 start_codon:yes stop_codon:yes gene_type:complete